MCAKEKQKKRINGRERQRSTCCMVIASLLRIAVCMICFHFLSSLEHSTTLFHKAYMYRAFMRVCVLFVYQVAIYSAFYNQFGPMNDFVTFTECVLLNGISVPLNCVSGIVSSSGGAFFSRHICIILITFTFFSSISF